MTSESKTEEVDFNDLFNEPEDYYQKEKPPTFVKHRLQSGEELELRLVGQNPLWGHILWNAGRTVADYLENQANIYVKDRNVLEFGAGAGLPSIVAAKNGAKMVVVTDYPDLELVQNLKLNIERCKLGGNIVAKSYLWGSPVEDLLSSLEDELNSNQGFDTVILADVLFNHSEHEKLVDSVLRTMRRDPKSCALVFFTPYRPWLLSKDLAFFPLAESKGLIVKKILETKMENVLFEKDPGDAELRKTVFGYKLTWKI